MGDISDEKYLSQLFENSDSFLEDIITKMANGTIECKKVTMTPVSKLLSKDMKHILKDYLKIDEKGISGKENLEDIAIKDCNLPDKMKKYVSVNWLKGGCQDECGSVFNALCTNAVILIPYILEKFPDATYEQLFPDTSKHLTEDIVEVECLIKITPGGGGLSGYYAPDESTVETELPGQKEKVLSYKDLFRNTMEKIGFEKVPSTPDFHDSESFVYGMDVGSDSPINLNFRNRSVRNSEDLINKNSIKAIPLRIEIKEDTEHWFLKSSRNGRSEYRNNASGKRFDYDIFYIRIGVEFQLQHPVVSTKRLLIDKGKSYKNFETSSIAIALNTIRTMIEMPGTMIADLDSDSSWGAKIILKNLNFSRDFTSDSDIKKGVSEHIRDKWSKFGAFQLFDFIRIMTDLNREDSSDRGRGITTSNKYFTSGGMSSITIEHSDYVPDHLNQILDNLSQVQEFFSRIAGEAETAHKYLEEKLQELKIDPNSKMTYRELVIKILVNEIKLDPMALLTKNEKYIQDIAKDFI